MSISVIELTGFLSGAASVGFGIRQRTITWPLNVISNALFALMFWQADRYLSLGFRVLMVGLAFYGWHLWRNRRSGGIQVLPLNPTTAWGLALAGLLVIVSAAALGNVVAYPAGLAETVAIVLTLAGQYLFAKQHLESWYVFILSDVLAAILYLELRYYPLAVLAVLTFAMCLIGLHQWRAARDLTRNRGTRCLMLRYRQGS